MPVTLHVVKVRFCSQCGDALPTKCDKCVKHPNRKPKIIELYDFPEPVKVAECGCCCLFTCQRPGCYKRFWRSVKNNAVTGKTRSSVLVCGRECRAWIANASRANAVDLPCGWCGKMVRRQKAQIPTNRIVFCTGGHWQLYQKKKFLESKQADEKRAMVECPACEDVVECQELSATDYKCNPKGHVFKLRYSNTLALK